MLLRNMHGWLHLTTNDLEFKDADLETHTWGISIVINGVMRLFPWPTVISVQVAPNQEEIT